MVKEVKKVNLTEEKKLAGCCGFYCGLCPKYQSAAKSRCPGCKILSLTISCKIFNCCVKERGFVTCAECDGFPCEKNNPEIFQWDDFVTRKVCIPNIKRIKKVGLETWLHEQMDRRAILENLLANYDEGRSRSFYCRATALMPINLIKEAADEVSEMVGKGKLDDSDIKGKARMCRGIIQELASKSNIDLKLRRKPK
jgi:hypothetical protein